MRVDEAGRDDLAGGVDRFIDIALKTGADVEDLVAFPDDLAVAKMAMAAVLMRDDMGGFNLPAHGSLIVSWRAGDSAGQRAKRTVQRFRFSHSGRRRLSFARSRSRSRS